MLIPTLSMLLLTHVPVNAPSSVFLRAQKEKAPKPDLAAAKKKISDYRSKLFAEYKDKPVNRKEVEEKMVPFAKEALKDIDIKAVPPEDATEWAQLFSVGRMNEQATVLQTAAVNYHEVQLMFTMMDVIPRLLSEGKDDEAYFMIKHTADFDASMIGMVGEGVNGALHRAGYDKTKPEFAEKCLKALRARVDLEPAPVGDRKNMMADYVYVDLSMKILEMKYAVAPNPALLEEMTALKAQFKDSKSTNAFGQGPAHRVDEFFDKVTAVGTAAPELVADKEIGGFKGLEALKGKVVMLDFMAHWCGPCKLALPGIKKLQDTYGPKGLQVVSVTSFYGYYGAKKEITPDQEFDYMQTFVKNYNMEWPVIFDTKQVTMSKYHVGPIPHMVLIDKKGVIRKVQVGNTEEGEAETLALVKKLVDEQPKRSLLGSALAYCKLKP
ncbi:MAG: TlpA disulfide reductase family protein [Armatimonadota bacterium]